MTEPERWRMWAHRYDNGELWNLGSRQYAEAHGLTRPVLEVDVVEVEDGDPAATHWGWMRAGKTEPTMVYPRKSLLDMCFHYGMQVEIDAGKGRMVRLVVTEVDDA